jgi:hypothetical protein
MRQYGCAACQWNRQARRLRGGLVAVRQRNGQGSLNAEAAHRLPAERTWLIKCRDGTSPVSGMERRCALSAINAEAARPRALTSGSARWLTSRVVGHVVASGPPPWAGSGSVYDEVRTRVSPRPPPGLD